METLTALGPVRRPGDSGITDRAWAREKVKLLWEIQAAPRPMRATGRGKKLFTAEKSPLLRDDLEPVVVEQPGYKELLPRGSTSKKIFFYSRTITRSCDLT